MYCRHHHHYHLLSSSWSAPSSSSSSSSVSHHGDSDDLQHHVINTRDFPRHDSCNCRCRSRRPPTQLRRRCRLKPRPISAPELTEHSVLSATPIQNRRISRGFENSCNSVMPSATHALAPTVRPSSVPEWRDAPSA